MKSLIKLLVCAFILNYGNSFSQTIANNNIPKSIYFLNTQNSNYQFSTFALNSKFNFSTYHFLNIERQNFRKGQLNIHPKAFNIKASKLTFDSYKKLQEKESLEKSFFKVSDLYDLPRNKRNL